MKKVSRYLCIYLIFIRLFIVSRDSQIFNSRSILLYSLVFFIVFLYAFSYFLLFFLFILVVLLSLLFLKKIFGFC